MFFDHHIFCCTNRREAGHTRGCCAEKMGEELRDYMKTRMKTLGIAKTRVNNAGCLDRCELGPCIVIYPEGVWYAPKTKEDIDEIIREHIQGGQIVKRLQLPA
jgi:(2Fe-2S) ferredoxin